MRVVSIWLLVVGFAPLDRHQALSLKTKIQQLKTEEMEVLK
jgi:hypothetical protein